jgi:hypothetical protein
MNFQQKPFIPKSKKEILEEARIIVDKMKYEIDKQIITKLKTQTQKKEQNHENMNNRNLEDFTFYIEGFSFPLIISHHLVRIGLEQISQKQLKEQQQKEQLKEKEKEKKNEKQTNTLAKTNIKAQTKTQIPQSKL